MRRAIWKAHNKKCYYCHEDVSIRELHIDHFIPNSTDENLKKEILNELKLERDFDFNGLKNLVPSHSLCNISRKGKYVPTAQSFSGVLVITERLLPMILKIKEKLDTEEKFDENISQIETYLEKGISSAEELYDYFTKENEYFKEVEHIDSSLIRISTKNVEVQCLLPKFPDVHGSMLITFRSLRIRDCLITFNHSEIVNEIFHGIGSSAENVFRRIIVHSDISKNSSVVQLGNNRFNISLDEVKQLCSIIDKIAPLYINAIKSTENVFKTREFSYSAKGRFRLLKISRSLWRNIIEFANKYDYEKGKTNWHIFDGNASYLKIYCKTPEDTSRNYRLFIYPEAVEHEMWEKFSLSDNDVWLCWEPSILVDNARDFQTNKVWSAEYAYNWLENNLIPAVIEYNRENQRPFLKRLFGKSNNLVPPFDGRGLNSTQASTTFTNLKYIKAIEKYVSQFQHFFAIYSNHYLSADAIIGVYKSILYCLGNCKMDAGTLEYLNVKLNGNQSIESIMSSVEQKLENLSGTKGVNGSNMEYALRSLCALLRESTFALEKEAAIATSLTSFLEKVYEEYCFLKDLERARAL
ncbi:HNH endonuclease [Aquibacillus kalidii]|uniref:HNH endonuclease n=1 Tax=Aquibacillus kalidii TaxID=2762597 RepID=UPI0016487A52|nr:HNH endonuclease signature motif containing protein [Aquibacillus kalidii]